jgi:hypothetical protein
MARRPWEKLLKTAQPQPGDEVAGQWTQKELEQMDADFCHALERAIAHGRERPSMPPEQHVVTAPPGWLNRKAQFDTFVLARPMNDRET